MSSRTRHFELTIWPHVRSAYNVARWLTRNTQDAEDVVQESLLKAYKSIDAFRGGDARVWILSIVRNTALNLLQRRRADLPIDWNPLQPEPTDQTPNPESRLVNRARRDQLRDALKRLDPEFRDVLVLRELEDLSYKEIAAVLDIPQGTVMSRLSRARQRLLLELAPSQEVRHDLP